MKSWVVFYMAKKTIYPGIRSRKNKVLKRPIDLTGINKVGYCPVGKSPTSTKTIAFIYIFTTHTFS